MAAMCRTIIHRGPDDEGIHIEAGVGLGTRRLSIIDLDGGHQPLANEDRTLWAAHNGEVYNFPELREELEARGHTFRTRTDTEAVLHAYEEWGDGFVDRLRGMFVTAIWDRPRRRLVIIRDRLGIKPLYYTLLADGTLVFGSELKAIIVHPGVRRELDPRALDLFLTLEYVPAPWSIFKGIQKLPAGHRLVYQDGRFDHEKYWDVPSPKERSRRIDTRNFPAVMDELYALLKESVKLRLISDVPLGAFLSGGIDSSTIVGLMRELGASPLKTFSIGFKDASYNELEHARRIARLFETEHEELILEPKALELTEMLVRHLDEPFGDFSDLPDLPRLQDGPGPRHGRPLRRRRRRGLRRLRDTTRPRSSPGFLWPPRSAGPRGRSSEDCLRRRRRRGRGTSSAASSRRSTIRRPCGTCAG